MNRQGSRIVLLSMTLVLVPFGAALAQTKHPGIDRGLDLLSRKQFNEAVLSFSTAVADTNSATAFFRRGQAFYLMNDFKRAFADFDKAADKEPQNAAAHLWKGAAAAYLNDHDQAVKEFEKAMRADPALVETYKQRGVKAIESVPGKVEGTKLEATMAKDEKAVNDYVDAANRASSQSAGHFRSGAVFSGLIKTSPKTDGIDLNADDAKIGKLTKRFGVDYFVLQNPAKAYKDADADLNANPNNAKACFERGRALQQMGSTDKALVDFGHAIELDPKNSKYYLARAYLYHLLNKDPQAAQDIQKAQELDPDLPKIITFDPGESGRKEDRRW